MRCIKYRWRRLRVIRLKYAMEVRLARKQPSRKSFLCSYLFFLFFNLVPSVCYTHCLCLRRGEKLAFLEKAISTFAERGKETRLLSWVRIEMTRVKQSLRLSRVFCFLALKKKSLDTSSLWLLDDDLTTLLILFPCQRFLLLIYFRREQLSEKCSSSVYLHLFFC